MRHQCVQIGLSLFLGLLDKVKICPIILIPKATVISTIIRPQLKRELGALKASYIQIAALVGEAAEQKV